MKQNYAYRDLAREKLGDGIFASNWLYGVLVYVVYSLIVGVLSVTGIGDALIFIFTGPIAFSLMNVFMRFVRNEDEKPTLERLFDPFKNRLSELTITGILVGLYTMLWSILLIIPGIVKSYSYSASLYIANEQGLSSNEAITKSRKLMNGHKGQLFLLDLSFIGWYLLGLFCFGIGIFFVIPYHNTAKALFFKDLLAESDNVIEVDAM